MNRRSLAIALSLALILSTGSSFAAEIPGSSFSKANARVEKEITSVLDTLNKAYMEGNIDAALSIVANDENIVFIGTSEADKVEGIEALKTAFNQDFDSFKTLSAEYTWVDITTNGKITLVAADFSGQLQTNAGEIKNISARQTLVLEKRKGKWLILQSHFSFPVEMMQKEIQSAGTKQQMEKEIDEDLSAMPIKNDHVGQETQEEITDEEIVDEDA